MRVAEGVRPPPFAPPSSAHWTHLHWSGTRCTKRAPWTAATSAMDATSKRLRSHTERTVGEMRRGGRLVSAPLLHPHGHSSFAEGKGLVDGDLTPNVPGHSAISASADRGTQHTKVPRVAGSALRASRYQVARRGKWRNPLAGRDRGLLLRVVCPRQTRSDHEGGAMGGGHTPSAPHLAHRTLRVRSGAQGSRVDRARHPRR